MGNIKKKEETKLVKISSEESKKLNEKYGVRYGENGISIHGKFKKKNGKSHYLCESKYNLQCLREIRNGVKHTN